ncbi:magnesium-translocating P-type ATPase [Clostridium baratii]|uniref:magnesium-translocating P-type ATPase n=1 Tax=Clostridium baratii TaxID=1561 RepID=UPI0009A35771|nr:magnesium-translocating P-type ATPase [Clostridium baratii]OPF50686.1 magnesium-translocating P-type ATPase [Clostridium baratii]OPF54070.1 magnesium-translocating P-type ATPase [Clostridium baratii]OPF58634.1 magnesium-translocating P-type ATPase [Clostridium baratii]OPF58994.1 magnesium-translocating P-type ATPase [Clostridium baratii]
MELRKDTKKRKKLSVAKERLMDASRTNIEQLYLKMDTSEKGLDESKVEILRDQFGLNEISHEKKDSVGKKLFEAFINPFTIVLFVLGIISLFTDVILVPKDQRDYSSVVIICIMVTISGVLRFVQELRSSKAAEELKAMVHTTVDVERDGRKEISLQELVPGDIIYLAAGDMIPADVRIIRVKDLFVGQSALTGESEPVEKFGGELSYEEAKDNNPLELNNLAFMGTNVISGSALALVITTGDGTYFGEIGKSLTGKKVKTNFDIGVNKVSFLLIKFMAIMVPIVFFLNGFTKGSWLQAFLFALSVAVGITPEMLPMIVTTNLAKGAYAMAKRKTVVKKLDSIQNFGSMDILCTDKTGTLTQDKIILERHLDINGKTDDRVLRHGFLNSYYQTGLKNLMDLAIIDHAIKYGMRELESKYVKVDEIPFDFSRKRMSVVLKDKNSKIQLITKGAIEEMLDISSYVEDDGKVLPLTKEIREKIIKTVNKLNSEGMRVIGIAQKTEENGREEFSVNDENDMVLMGYMGFLDPPKETTTKAIKALKDYGVGVKVLTGDNEAVTACVCSQVGIKNKKILLGSEIENMDDSELQKKVEETDIFAKLSPNQKTRIVTSLRENGHTVGFLGDGINDAGAMRAADVGISVDTAVDIAKECADIILLEKDLMVLEGGVLEGRKTFGNIIKYIKMTTSSNFGNMLSVLVASAFLPFLPMLPIQILVLNLIYDISQIVIPWDNMDEDYLKVPRKWDASSIARFMVIFGPTSSIFDITTFLVMWFVYGCNSASNPHLVSLFNTGWFVESLWTQTLIIHMIRTKKIPFIQSRASSPVIAMTVIALIVGTIIPFIALGGALQMTELSTSYFGILIITVIAYMLLCQLVKKIYIGKYKELL